MRCAESLRVQAHFDGELDAISSLNLEQHTQHCGECSELLASLERTRATLRGSLREVRTPPELRARVLRGLDVEDGTGGAQRRTPARRSWRLPTFWWGSLSGAGATVVAGAVAYGVLMLPPANRVVDSVMEAHVSSLMSGHLIDVVSTDKHTVKPWFAGHAELSPVVADFAAQGYRLTGGRVDYLERERAAVTVYQHGPHVINVFCWIAPRGPLPGNVTRQGYHLAFWRSGDLAYAAVSDTGWDELVGLERLLRDLAAKDSTPGSTSASKDSSPATDSSASKE